MLRRVIFVTAASFALAGSGFAQSQMPFALDWQFEGPAAPYFMALENGHFEAEGLSVEITAGQGSLDAIPKVATGAFPVGFADMASLIKFLDQNPDAPVTGVMMFYDKPAFAIVGRKSLGIEEPKDLEGRVLGAPPPDGAWAQFQVFATANGIDVSKVTVEPVGFPTREPMLAEGQVAAVTGFSFTSFLNSIRLGVPEEDMTVLLMADYGLELYGNVIIANTEFAKENPEQLTGFLRAVAKGLQDTVNDPGAGVDAMVSRNPAMDKDLEVRRLELALRDNIMTDWVRENGVGGIDEARFARSLEQIAVTYEFINGPEASLYFDGSYLPDDGSLMVE
ncbi:ABC transporter substrate-binding protein [Devosia limi DSM 17137]|uniref:ABC transporter substrate-binding protein n=1 Tax=Devosia limi DSM 17137 TaxID=1121477 RepID=A0A0F5L507_9HYPH|nr:ABC transporter substrate-binding protein [Devosia limi]KKB77305.1 ABC transporter substrate-binding protein [Devosia limi DSM 17137]SHE65443.1 NitT/TauT family transport system substrate-binding protein [Devosia limi DSM 17137]